MQFSSILTTCGRIYSALAAWIFVQMSSKPPVASRADIKTYTTDICSNTLIEGIHIGMLKCIQVLVAVCTKDWTHSIGCHTRPIGVSTVNQSVANRVISYVTRKRGKNPSLNTLPYYWSHMIQYGQSLEWANLNQTLHIYQLPAKQSLRNTWHCDWHPQSL